MLLKNRIAEAADDDEGYKLFVLAQELAEAWAQNRQIPPPRYAEWLQRREAENQPQFKAGQPASESPAETPAPAPAPEPAAEPATA